MVKHNHKMSIIIREYATGIAAQMGVNLTKISVIEGPRIGCLDVHLLNLTSGNTVSSALVYQTELSRLQNGFQCDRLETKIRAALSRMKTP